MESRQFVGDTPVKGGRPEVVVGSGAAARAGRGRVGGGHGVAKFPDGLSLLACVVLAVAATSYGVLRRGSARAIGIAVALLSVRGAVALVIVENHVLENVLVIAGVSAAQIGDAAVDDARV